jgi:hypothetical protein
MRKAFVALYAASVGTPCIPASDETKMMPPAPRAAIAGANLLASRAPARQLRSTAPAISCSLLPRKSPAWASAAFATTRPIGRSAVAVLS